MEHITVTGFMGLLGGIRMVPASYPLHGLTILFPSQS